VEGTDLKWRKASYSSNGGADCVEVASQWRKASYSSNGGGKCVEVAGQRSNVLIRDTKDRTGPVLRVTPQAWRTLMGQISLS